MDIAVWEVERTKETQLFISLLILKQFLEVDVKIACGYYKAPLLQTLGLIFHMFDIFHCKNKRKASSRSVQCV